MANTSMKVRPRLTVGMACFDDFDGVYFTVQSLQMYHADVLGQLEILVVDNHPAGKDGQAVKDFLTQWVPSARYIPAPDIVGTAAPRNLVFQEAAGEAVLCVDSHVLLARGALRALLQYYEENPACRDLLHGPMLDDRCQPYATHMEPIWREEMFGVWGSDPRGLHPEAPAFEIPMHGCGLLSCRKDAWLGFHPRFRGFGGEEGYIQEKFRQAGHRAYCLPALRWLHRFGRPAGVRYPLTREHKLRNYLLGRLELNQSYDDVLDQFASRMTRATIDQILAELGLPTIIDHWFPQRRVESQVSTSPSGGNDHLKPIASRVPTRDDLSVVAETATPKRQEPCFDLTLSARRVRELDGAVVSCETISDSPRIEVIRDLLSAEEAERIIDFAGPKMVASRVYGVGSRPSSEYRTSFGADLRIDEHPLAASIYQRVAAICDCPVDHIEALQVLRYDPGQFFVEHFDFIPEDLEHYRYGGQRLKSLVTYLNDLPPGETGARTCFPHLHLRVRCGRGMGLLWDNVDAEGNLEMRSLHAGEAPVNATKFVMACFVRAHAVPAQVRPPVDSETFASDAA